MALNIGELVGMIRADDSGWRHGLQEAQLRLAGFTRMADGRLRDMHGRFVSESDAMGRTLGTRISRGVNVAVAALKKVAPAAAGVAAGVPAVAALTAALGGLAAGAVAAGAAVGAFKLAAQPQLAQMKEASGAADKLAKAQEDEARKGALAAKLKAQGSDLAKKAEKAYTTSRLATKDAEMAYQRQTAGMPKATAEAALAQAKLKQAHEDWSASLASTTMPVFTRGLNLLRGLLPSLTPFVKAAADAFGSLLTRVEAGTKGAGFKKWADDMAAASGGALKNFLNVIVNLGKGFAGMMQAFLPASAGVTGGLVSMTGAFATWGAGLKDSEGFAQFLALAREGAGMLGTLAGAAVRVLVALSPLIGITAQLAMWFAQLVNAIPPDVLAAIGTGIAAIALAVKLYTMYTRVAAVVTRLWAAAQAFLNIVMSMNPIGLVVIAIVALIAIIVLAYQKSETFRNIVQAVWQFLKDQITSRVREILAVIQWFADLPGKVSKWWEELKAAAIRKMAELVVWVQSLPGKIRAALTIMPTMLRNAASTAWEGFKSAATRKATEFVSWVRGLPGKIRSGIGKLNSLLYSAGKDVVMGLWNGIRDMGGWLAGKISGWAKSVVPGPIASALGINSPSKVTAEQGRWIARGLIVGLTGSAKQVQAASDRIAGIIARSLTGKKRRATAARIDTGESALMRLAAREQAVAARLKAANKSLADQVKARDELASTVRKGVLDAANITSEQGAQTATSIWANLTARLQQATRFAAQLATLRAKGVRADLIAQVAQAGVEQGASAAAALAAASKGEIAQINNVQAQLVAAAGQAGSVAGNAMYGAGVQAAQGLVQGLQREQTAIERQMLAIARAMQTAIKRALGIRSPSRVMAALGQYIPAGLIQGIESGRSAVDASMASLVTPPRPALAGVGTGIGVAGMDSRASTPVVRLELISSGSSVDDFLVERLRKGIQVRGGDVELVLGQRR